MKNRSVTIKAGGGGPAEPVPYLVPSDWTTKNIRVKAEPTAERHPQCDPCEYVNVILNSERSERDSGSILRCGLSLTLARSRNKFGMTIKKVPSLRGVSEANDVAISLSTHQWLTGSPRATALAMTRAFTMAEILLSLTIIGVVAAITLPSLTGNINERTWNTQRKALYARFSQAIMLMPALNGYGTLTEESSSGAGDAIDTAAETFVTNGLAKVLKINNICDNDHLPDCGIPEKMINLVGTTIDTPKKLSDLNANNISFNYSDGSQSQSISLIDTKAAAFETGNGESILAFYNPVCRGSLNESMMMNPQLTMCANFVYDLNGNKGPNTVGKDIGFISAYYPSDVAVVAPYPYVRDAAGTYSHGDAAKACTALDSEYRLSNITELSAMFANLKLMSNSTSSIGDGEYYWSSDKVSSNKAWYYWSGGWANCWGEHAYSGDNTSRQYSVRCVKR